LTIGEQTSEGLDFRLAFYVWEMSTGRRPTDIDRIGQQKVYIYESIWTDDNPT
jgi:hypothetical protein